MRDVIYKGECEHLENTSIAEKDCLKRYITITNPRTGIEEVLAFCNDALKLKAQKIAVERSKDNAWYGNTPVVEAIEDEIYKHVGLDGRGRTDSSKNITSYIFLKKICDRPFTCVYVSIPQLIEFYHAEPSYYLAMQIKEATLEFIGGLKSIASQKRYKDLIRQAKKLNHYYNHDIELVELINELFKLTIRNN